MSCHVVAGVNGHSSEIDLQVRGITQSFAMPHLYNTVCNSAFSYKNV